MEFIKDRIANMINELRSNPNIRVIYEELHPPLTPQTITEHFNEKGLPASQEILDFFSQLDGFSLWWVNINNPRYNKNKFDKYKGNFDIAAMDICDGFISIEHLLNILDPDMRLGTIIDDIYIGKKEEFLGKEQDSMSIRNKLWHLDYFDYSSSENTILMHLNINQAPFVLLPTDDYSTLSETRYLTFNSYLEFLIWSKGLKKTRYDFFQRRNDFIQVESLDKKHFESLPPIDIDNLY